MYLSVDLDYFFIESNFYNPPKDWYDYKKCIKFLDRIKHIQNKIIVDEHHLILDHINNSNCHDILHVDYHQDLAFPYKYIEKYGKKDNVYLECGTFYYFVKDKKDKKFTWYYPYYEDCIRKSMGLCVDELEKPLSKANFIFKDQKTKCGLPTNKELSNVTHLGIALSLDYLDVCNNDLYLVCEKLISMFDYDTIISLFNNYKYLNTSKELMNVKDKLEKNYGN